MNHEKHSGWSYTKIMKFSIHSNLERCYLFPESLPFSHDEVIKIHTLWSFQNLGVQGGSYFGKK